MNGQNTGRSSPLISALTGEIIVSAYRKNLQGVVASMAEVRSLFWITVLRKLTKSIILNRYDCKWVRAMHYPNPNPGPIPRDRTEQASYIFLLFLCSVRRTVHMELVSNLSTTDFSRFLRD